MKLKNCGNQISKYKKSNISELKKNLIILNNGYLSVFNYKETAIKFSTLWPVSTLTFSYLAKETFTHPF